MPDAAEEVEQEITEAVANMFKRFGADPTMIKIYMPIFFAEEPVGLKEISEKTGYSVSTVCNTMEILERLFDIRKYKKPGSKRIYFECRHNLMEAMSKGAYESKKALDMMMNKVEEMEKKLEGEKTDKSKRYLGYIRKIKDDYAEYGMMMDYVIKIHEGRLVREVV